MRFNFLDKIQERAIAACRYSDFDRMPIVGEVSCKETGEIRPYVTDRNVQHELQLKLAVRFWANKAQYAQARRTAEGDLARLINGEALGLINRARKAVFDGDAKAALGWLSELQSAIEHRE